MRKERPEHEEPGILTDRTELPIRRPTADEEQKETSSGKKKRHTKMSVTITHPKAHDILARSEETADSTQEKKIRDDAALTCPGGLPLIGESGFHGLEGSQAVVSTPWKRTRKKKGEHNDERAASTTRSRRSGPGSASAWNTVMQEPCATAE